MNFSNKLKDLCQIKGTQTLNATKMLQILVMTGQFRLQVSSSYLSVTNLAAYGRIRFYNERNQSIPTFCNDFHNMAYNYAVF